MHKLYENIVPVVTVHTHLYEYPQSIFIETHMH